LDFIKNRKFPNREGVFPPQSIIMRTKRKRGRRAANTKPAPAAQVAVAAPNPAVSLATQLVLRGHAREVIARLAVAMSKCQRFKSVKGTKLLALVALLKAANIKANTSTVSLWKQQFLQDPLSLRQEKYAGRVLIGSNDE
jgi:hypothetical protein